MFLLYLRLYLSTWLVGFVFPQHLTSSRHHLAFPLAELKRALKIHTWRYPPSADMNLLNYLIIVYSKSWNACIQLPIAR